MLDEENTFSIDDVVEEIEELATQYIELFFQNKTSYNGYEISPDELYSSKNLKMVLENNICKSVEIAYEMMANRLEFQTEGNSDGSVEPAIKHVLAILDECSTMRIPKCFAGGLLVMYLRLCDGLNENI